jgi:hypothetical protein
VGYKAGTHEDESDRGRRAIQAKVVAASVVLGRHGHGQEAKRESRERDEDTYYRGSGAWLQSCPTFEGILGDMPRVNVHCTSFCHRHGCTARIQPNFGMKENVLRKC